MLWEGQYEKDTVDLKKLTVEQMMDTYPKLGTIPHLL